MTGPDMNTNLTNGGVRCRWREAEKNAGEGNEWKSLGTRKEMIDWKNTGNRAQLIGQMWRQKTGW